RIEHVELVRGTAEASLLELSGHRDQPIGDARNVLARGASAPGVGARPAVAEDAPREDEAVLVRWAQVGDRLEVRVLDQPRADLQLWLDVCLRAVRADQRRIPPAAEQEADRLGENRLPRSRLAGDRVEAGREVELGVADEDEVLDAQTAQHQRDGM